MKAKKKYSIRRRIIAVILLCWLIPLMLTMGVIGYYMFSNHFANKAAAQVEQLTFNDQICVERLNGLIVSSKAATYDHDIKKAYLKYEKGEISERSLLSISGSYFQRAYSNNIGVRDAILWFYGNPRGMTYSTYNESVGGGYKEVVRYWNEDHSEVYAFAKNLGTDTKFIRVNDRLYLVRNMVDRTYRPIGAIVFRVNEDYCFDKISMFPAGTDVTIKLGSCTIQLQGMEVDVWPLKLQESVPTSGYKWVDGELYFFHVLEGEDFWMKTFVRYSDGSNFMQTYGYAIILIGTAIFVIPLLWMCLTMFQRDFTEPVTSMIEGANEIENGVLGYQIEEQAESKEFYYLIETFNHMSSKLKEQFTKIYEEELALKDAKIMALQSHINPHFLNNTLEIINWEARMEGNVKVSQMIEALATLMDTTIDRKKRPEVLMSEEMVNVKAYIYIMSRRLGSRLEVINELPEEIMQYKVPRLIMQPVIENAIEHGVARRKHGVVVLRGRVEGKYLYIEVINDSTLTDEAEQKIKRLLDPEYDTSKEPSGNMGIANVNQRLRILYGEPCGLVVEKMGEDHVVARLTILADKDSKIIQ